MNVESEFLRAVGRFDRLAAKLAELREDHFRADPEAINYGDVGSVNYAADRLYAILQHYGIVKDIAA